MAEEAFGHYRLQGLLGQGGMGQVYRAYDTSTDRVVALKVLPPNAAEDPTFQQRFRREAHTAAGLSDPHVVPIHRYGEIDGRLYVDMRLIEGRDLGVVLREEGRGLDPARAVRIVEQVAEALDAAHSAGLVHRDVKPSNILLTRRDFVYLIDFGIARANDETRLTSTGAAIGTFAYMAPERYETLEAEPRSDVYALACVLHECLTGQQPFPGNSLQQQIAAHMAKPPPRPSVMAAGVSPVFDGVIAKGMAKNPDERFQTVIELADAASAALAGRTNRAPPPPQSERVPPWRPPQPPQSERVPPWRPPQPPDRPPARQFYGAPAEPTEAPALRTESLASRGVEATGSKQLRLAGLLLIGTVSVLVIAPSFARPTPSSSMHVFFVANGWLSILIAVSLVLASGAFGLIGMHLRSEGSRAPAIAAWVVGAAFVVLAVQSMFHFYGSLRATVLIAGAVFVSLATFGITAAVTIRQRWYLWAAAAGFCGIFACVVAEVYIPWLFPFSSAWLPLFLIFASYVYLRGQRRPCGLLAVPGLLIMSFALVIILEWLGNFFGHYVDLEDFFRAFHPYYYVSRSSYYYGSYHYYRDEVPSNVFFAAALMASLAFALLGTKLRTLRYNWTAVTAAWVLGATLLSSAVIHNIYSAIAIFVLLIVFGVSALISARSSWALCACAAGLLGAILWIVISDVPGVAIQICFVAWCALMFMFGFFLYRSREGARDSAAQPPMAPPGPPNERVDNWGPTMHRPQW